MLGGRETSSSKERRKSSDFEDGKHVLHCVHGHVPQLTKLSSDAVLLEDILYFKLMRDVLDINVANSYNTHTHTQHLNHLQSHLESQ